MVSESGERPDAIRWFVTLWALAIAITVGNLLWHIAEVDGLSAAILLVSQAIYVVFIALAAGRRKWAVYVVLALLVLDIGRFALNAQAIAELSTEQVLLAIATLVLAAAGTRMAFARSASAWFAGAAVRLTQEERARQRRRWRLVGGGLAAAMVLLVAYTLTWTQFVDWEEVRRDCLEGGDGVDRIGACTRIIDAGVVDGRALSEVHIARGDAGGLPEGPGLRVHRVQADYFQATEADPTNTTAWLRYGSGLYHRNGTPVRGALTAFERALELAPEDGHVRGLYGQTLRLDGRADEALPHLQAGLAAEPDNQITALELANAYYDTGDFAAAQTTAEELLARDGLDEANLVPALRVRALSLMQLGRYGEASAIIDRVRGELPWVDVDRDWGSQETALAQVLAHCLAGDAAAARTTIDDRLNAFGLPAADWRRLFLEWGYAEPADLPAPQAGDDVPEALSTTFDAWIADGCPQPEFGATAEN
ncbi:MAG: tetratricopeptide repeat protein [Rhodospirillaceae bacterium]|nr:tetratricopeptide repeat protein [Rhodospirillaceae bacterium]